MGARKHSAGENPKDMRYRFALRGFPDANILNCHRDDHRIFRRVLSHAFSTQSMFDQQPLIMRYVDLLIAQLHNRCKDGAEPQDMVSWYNWTTFDIIGDLAFGESFGCLEAGEYHPWVASIFATLKLGVFMQCSVFFPWIRPILLRLAPKGLAKKREEHVALTKSRVKTRASIQAQRHDFMEAMLQSKNTEVYTPLWLFSSPFNQRMRILMLIFRIQ